MASLSCSKILGLVSIYSRIRGRKGVEKFSIEAKGPVWEKQRPKDHGLLGAEHMARRGPSQFVFSY